MTRQPGLDWLVSGDGRTLRLALEQAILDMRQYLRLVPRERMP